MSFLLEIIGANDLEGSGNAIGSTNESPPIGARDALGIHGDVIDEPNGPASGHIPNSSAFALEPKQVTPVNGQQGWTGTKVILENDAADTSIHFIHIPFENSPVHHEDAQIVTFPEGHLHVAAFLEDADTSDFLFCNEIPVV